MAGNTIVRNNLMTRKDYSPYCGDTGCRYNMPRTDFKKDQFECMCGWRSEFPADFIAEYKAHWKKEKSNA